MPLPIPLIRISPGNGRLLDSEPDKESPPAPIPLSPLSKKQILRRMLNNLKAIYLRQGDLLRGLSVVERLLILEPNSVSEIRDRGLLYVKLECFPQALQDLEAYLRLSAHADDAPEVRDQVVSLRRLVTLIH